MAKDRDRHADKCDQLCWRNLAKIRQVVRRINNHWCKCPKCAPKLVPRVFGLWMGADRFGTGIDEVLCANFKYCFIERNYLWEIDSSHGGNFSCTKEVYVEYWVEKLAYWSNRTVPSRVVLGSFQWINMKRNLEVPLTYATVHQQRWTHQQSNFNQSHLGKT